MNEIQKIEELLERLLFNYPLTAWTAILKDLAKETGPEVREIALKLIVKINS